ncbi:MAG: hypothetical protein H7Y86_03450 [Rhizobacter sp.]|nr:hypothetical protein [Ferruginibacter sp.]
MKQLLLFIAFCCTLNSFGQSKPADRILYGIVTADTLSKAPYDAWYKKNYNDYTVNDVVKAGLRSAALKGIKMEAFFGSWCGDSKRELPRFIKVLDEMNFDKTNLKIIGTGSSDSLYKQSPQHEEKGKGIYRVPVFIVYKNGVEVNRINEFPVQTLERDLLAIIQNEHYIPNYKSFGSITKWLQQDILADSNVSMRGLMNQLRPLVNDENELNSLAYLLLKQQQQKEALMIFRINAGLYPASANTLSSLGEAYLETGDKIKAISFLERSLEYQPSPALIKEILGLMYKAKGL